MSRSKPFRCDCATDASYLLRLNAWQADLAETVRRQAIAPLKPAKPQQPCDIGLFSDDANQLDMCEMFMDPTNPP